MSLLSLFLSGPANVASVAALCLPLADEVDVVVAGLAAAHVLPLPDIVPGVPHYNAVLRIQSHKAFPLPPDCPS